MSKKIRSTLSLLLAAVLMLSMMTMGVYAEDYSGIKVAGTEISTDVFYYATEYGVEPYPSDYVLNDGDSYIILSSSGVLTMHNFNLTSATAANGQDDTFSGIYVPASCTGLQVSLEGSNSIAFNSCYPVFAEDGSQSASSSCAVKAPGTDLTICGNGSLTVNSLDMTGYGTAESVAVSARNITLNDGAVLNATAGAVDAGNSCGIFSGSVVLSGTGTSVTANASGSAFSCIPVSGAENCQVSVISDWNQGLTSSGSATVYLTENTPEQESEAEPEYEPEPETEPVYEPVIEPEPEPEVWVDTRVPAVMPDISGFYVISCQSEANNDGYIVFPEGYSYEYRMGTEGDYIWLDTNGVSWLTPGIYQVRIRESTEYLASEPYTFEISAYVAPTPEPTLEPTPDNRVPAIMPDLSTFYVVNCQNESNNDGYIIFPEGYSYEYRAGTEGDYTWLDSNGISWLTPGIYQVRIRESAEYLASEPYTFEIYAYIAPTPEPTPEPTPDTRVPATMPDLSGFYVISCQTEANNDGYIVFPEGYLYEWRAGSEGDFTPVDVNGISWLTPGIYQVRLRESSEHLASEPYTFEIYAYVAPTPEPTPDPTPEPTPDPTPEPTPEPIPEVVQTPSPTPEETVQVVSPSTEEPSADFTEPVMSVMMVPQVKVSGDVEVETGDGQKAADTTEQEPLVTSDTPEVTKAATPTDIAFYGITNNSGILKGNGLNNTLKYRLGTAEGDYLPLTVTDGIATVSGLGDGSMISIITPGDGTTTLDSDPLVIQINVSKTPSADEFAVTACTTLNQNDGTLTVPAGNKYEYRKSGTVGFSTIEGDTNSPVTVTGLTPGSYDIRIRAAGTYLASDFISVEIGSYTAPDARPAPDVTFTAADDRSGYLNGVDTSMNYRLGTDGNWNPITGTSIYFTNLYKGLVIQVYYPATETTVASAVKEIVIDQQATPTGDFISVTDCTSSSNNNGIITLSCGNYTDYEFRYGSSGTFTAITAPVISGLESGTYYIRTRCSGAKLASKLCSVVVGEYIPKSGLDCQAISMLPYEKIFDTTDGYSTLTVTFYPLNTTNQTVTFTSSNNSVINFGSQATTTAGTNGTATIRMYPVGTGEATITATTANGKTATCHVTVSFEYRFTYNKSGTWYYDRGGDYTVQTNGPLSRFSALKINGQVVNPQYYTTRANTDGTTILTITQYAMSCLNHGAYQRIQLCYNDGGTATTFLHIMSVTDKPITGDDGNPVLWTVLGLTSLSVLAAVTVISRKKKHSEI